jgi:hypothetical protein
MALGQRIENSRDVLHDDVASIRALEDFLLPCREVMLSRGFMPLDRKRVIGPNMKADLRRDGLVIHVKRT